MSADFESKTTFQGLTFKLYRGEGAALLAFDLAADLATSDFVGFSIEVRYPGADHWGVLHNRLHFDYPPTPEQPRTFPSTEAPFQKFRWIHVPSEILPGLFRYRVTACYMGADGTLRKGVSLENQVSLEAQTISGFVNIGFTRGFASSQAYGDRFNNETRILPPARSAPRAYLDLDMAPFEKNYAWLGFEARQLILQVLDQVANDPELTLDALIYESKEPDILRRLEGLGPRVRAIIDDHGDQGAADSCESLSAARLAAAGAQVKRLHFSSQQHNKVLIVRRAGKAIRVLGGSTNFALRGLYIQANNVLLFDDETVAGKFAEVFDAYWTAPTTFRKNPLSQQWWVVRDQPGSKVSLCFAPHADSALSLDPIAASIEQATSSVLYSIVFLSLINGKVRDALDALMQRSLFSYGVAQRTGKLAVRKPDGSVGLLPFSYLASNAPAPFKAEWSGNAGNMVHNKFVVTDFNGANPTVYTGSSNLAGGGEKNNGDHLIRIEDRKIAVVYAIEALRLFDHFHFRFNASLPGALQTLRLAKPPAAGEKTWFDAYYSPGHVKARDRELFVK
ncbi:phospholipase D-like domain-containing protein [Pseudomonas sp. B22129]|uniref:phospholipase D-like domain-containing protein n=1 Tax=Pseudomonas sp. B22129 TaxID=3235111 RepID=UPI0037838980